MNYTSPVMTMWALLSHPSVVLGASYEAAAL